MKMVDLSLNTLLEVMRVKLSNANGQENGLNIVKSKVLNRLSKFSALVSNSCIVSVIWYEKGNMHIRNIQKTQPPYNADK